MCKMAELLSMIYSKTTELWSLIGILNKVIALIYMVFFYLNWGEHDELLFICHGVDKI